MSTTPQPVQEEERVCPRCGGDGREVIGPSMPDKIGRLVRTCTRCGGSGRLLAFRAELDTP